MFCIVIRKLSPLLPNLGGGRIGEWLQGGQGQQPQGNTLKTK